MDIFTIIKRIFNGCYEIAEGLLPYVCLLCQSPSHRKLDLCYDCEHSLPRFLNVCSRCAIKLPEFYSHDMCGCCLRKQPEFYKIYSLVSYEPPISNLIVALKFHRKLMVARVLSKLMIERLMQVYAHSDLPEVIIPIPLHPSRLAARGFNQALELARPISKALRIPLMCRNFLRVRNTATQTSLTKKYRAKNLKNAFVFKKYQAFNHVALIDDVVTTGCTVNEMSRVLKKAGVKRIDVWCCARTH